MQDTGYTFDALGSDGVGNITQRQVRGHQGHTQAAGGQHHYHLRGVGQLGKELGMPGEGDTAFVDHALVHGGGDHPGKMPIQAALPGAGQGFQHERRVGFVELAWYYRGCKRGIPHVQAARGCWPVGPLARGDWQQADGQPQLRGPLGEQVTAGDGDQGVGLGVCGEQQAQVGAYAGRLAGGDGEAQGLHWAAWSAPGSLIST
ncbi:hypothetical protein D3C79_664200 [compost metagenome]